MTPEGWKCVECQTVWAPFIDRCTCRLPKQQNAVLVDAHAEKWNPPDVEAMPQSNPFKTTQPIADPFAKGIQWIPPRKIEVERCSACFARGRVAYHGNVQDVCPESLYQRQ